MFAAHDGVWTSRALFELKLLDSFMKESQRLSPGSLCKPADRICFPGVMRIRC